VRIQGLHRRPEVAALGHGEKKTIQIVAVLGLTIAIAAVVYSVRTGSRTDQYYDDAHLKCTACGHEFTMTVADMAKARGAAGNPHKKMTCPKCHKDAGEEMVRCEKCGSWFLATPSGDGLSLKCPHCGFDPNAPPRR
jgi:phage terminase large subunit GpA-like protein